MYGEGFDIRDFGRGGLNAVRICDCGFVVAVRGEDMRPPFGEDFYGGCFCVIYFGERRVSGLGFGRGDGTGGLDDPSARIRTKVKGTYNSQLRQRSSIASRQISRTGGLTNTK